MSRVFPTDNEKWKVKMSIGKRITRSKTSSSAVTPARKVIIQRTPFKQKHQSEKSKEELLKFIVESKQQIDLKARSAIGLVEKWQRDTCARFDMIQQHIVQLHNPQMVENTPRFIAIAETPEDSINDSAKIDSPELNVPVSKVSEEAAEETERSSTQSVERVAFPSMPIIFEELDGEDNFNAFLAEPIQKNEERRKTGSVARTKVSDYPIRRNSRSIHSSVLAMSSSTPKIVLEMPNDKPKVDEKSKPSATPEILEKQKRVENKPISNGKSVKSNPLSESDPKKLAVIQKLRDLQKLLNGCDKKIVQEATDRSGQAYPTPVV